MHHLRTDAHNKVRGTRRAYLQCHRSLVALGLCLLLPAAGALAQWADGQNAEYVVGQADFTSGVGTAAQNSLKTPRGVAIDLTNSKLYVADASNHRILRYSYPVSADQPNAELVFGQSDYTSNSSNAGGAVSASTFYFPSAITVDATGRLWVADSSNNRVVWYDAAHSDSSHKPDADGVLGQANFTSGTENRGGSTAVNSLYGVRDVAIDASGNLWVADRVNNRVLRYDDAANKSDGADADGVLGQANFTSNMENRAGPAAANTLNYPVACCFSGSALFVGDSENNRVLRFDSAASKSDGADADGVLGQTSLANRLPNRGGSVGQATLDSPYGLAVDDAGRLYVSDEENSRIVTYNSAASKGDGANADNVLGQADFTSNTGAIGQARLNGERKVAIDSVNGKLVVTDRSNSRVLVFSSSSGLPVTLSQFGIE